MVATLTGIFGLGIPGAAMGAALVGNFSNGNVQGSGSDQSAVNGSGGAEFSGGGLKFISGNSAPNLNQVSGNAESNNAVIGSEGGGGGTLIGSGSQLNTQAIQSEQVAKKGTQVSLNIESGTQIIGLNAGDAIIGSPTQVSDQATNSVQEAAGRPSMTTFIGGPTNKGPITETSMNILDSCELVIGGGAGTC
jgi:hypothetical protein